jgi:Cu/Ag efflux protein CusF
MRTSVLAGFFLAAICAVTPAAAFQAELPGAAATLADQIAATGPREVAVFAFTDSQGRITELGRFLAQEMARGLAASKKPITVVDLAAAERDRLAALIAAAKRAGAGGLNPATGRAPGNLPGVNAFVTGTLAPLSDRVGVSIEVLDQTMARVLAVASVNIARTKAIEDLLASETATGGAGGNRVYQNQAIQMFPGAAVVPTAAPSPPAPKAAPPAAGRKAYTFHGKVETVDRRAQSLGVKGEKIEGWMDAMTMMYPVDDPAILDKLAVGDQITATVFDGDYSLHAIRIAAPNSGTPDVKN